ncbi:MAG: DUF2829 domain-containing protein [Pyrinomonadaceae bacterium]
MSEFRYLNFGQALDALHHGKKVQRDGWNGNGVWIVLVPGQPEIELKPGNPYHAALNGTDTYGSYGQSHVTIKPHIDMRMEDGEMQPGWNASQADLLALDWRVV